MKARAGRWVTGVALAVLLMAACGDPEETEVLGVQIERSETEAPDEGSPTPTSTPASVTTAPATTPAPDTAATSEPAPPPTTAPPPEPAPPEPQAPPPAEAQSLPAGPGWSYGTWTPVSEQEWSDPDTCCWTDTSGAPAIERGEQPPRLFTDVRDGETYPDGRPGFQQPSRLAACDSWIEAAPDRPVRVHGTVTVELLYGDVATTAAYEVDELLAAGQRFELPRTQGHRVEAAQGLQVTCRTSFQPA